MSSNTAEAIQNRGEVADHQDSQLHVRNRAHLAELSEGPLLPPVTLYTRWGKTSLDLIVACLLLILLTIPMLLIAFLIRLDSPGNPFFCQTRVGKNGEAFVICKFRTMRVRTDSALKFLDDGRGQASHKVRNDPRVTRVGRFLRKSSLDELPQLLNVVRGEMSIIGPRPELPELVAQYEPWQLARHEVKPGITGWWQVSGRSNQPMHDNTHLDLYYVESVSPALDLRIAWRTITVVLRGVGAF
jgi:lipopolysaccharide/colanic/teichoic acid biosynthesis glycosyltransferase